MPIDPISPLGSGGLQVAQSQGKDVSAPASGTFGQLLMDNLDRVNAMQQESGRMVTNMLLGKEADITRVMATSEKAGVAFETFMAVRNKLVEAYQEVLRYRI